MMRIPTADFVRQVFNYDPSTGIFVRKVRTANRIKCGDIAGCRSAKGYWLIKVFGRTFRAHRLAWLYMTGEWPLLEIDHINGNGFDNRWENLRLATTRQNQENSRKRQDNSSGFKGVTWNRRSEKWCARIWIGGKRRNLGYFIKPQEAHAAYCKAAEEHFGEFANFGVTPCASSSNPRSHVHACV